MGNEYERAWTLLKEIMSQLEGYSLDLEVAVSWMEAIERAVKA